MKASCCREPNTYLPKPPNYVVYIQPNQTMSNQIRSSAFDLSDSIMDFVIQNNTRRRTGKELEENIWGREPKPPNQGAAILELSWKYCGIAPLFSFRFYISSCLFSVNTASMSKCPLTCYPCGIAQIRKEGAVFYLFVSETLSQNPAKCLDFRTISNH